MIVDLKKKITNQSLQPGSAFLVSQATVLNQAEVSRYLTQLNTHLEGVLEKKSADVDLITDSVRQLQDQLASLIEQSNRLAAGEPTIERRTPDIDQQQDGEPEPTPAEEGEAVEGADEGIHFEIEPGAEPMDGQVGMEAPMEGGEAEPGKKTSFHLSLFSKQSMTRTRLTETLFLWLGMKRAPCGRGLRQRNGSEVLVHVRSV